MIIDQLNILLENRVQIVSSVSDIPNDGYMVYVLSLDERAIVVGHGQKNRAKIICDNISTSTSGHIKAIFVRLYHKYCDSQNYSRFVIPCENKKEAQEIEHRVHSVIGGDNRDLPKEIINALFENLKSDSIVYLVLKIALLSSYDGLSDLRGWRNKGLLDDSTWQVISERLGI